VLIRAAGGTLRLAPDAGVKASGEDEVGASIDGGGWLAGAAAAIGGTLCGRIDEPGEAIRSDDADEPPTIAIGDGVRTEGGAFGGTITLPNGDVMLSVDGCIEPGADDGGGAATGVPCGSVFDDRP
jgi:hypothetical protein